MSDVDLVDRSNPGPAAQQLDILRDCADLANEWPPNVDIVWVLWAHGPFGVSDEPSVAATAFNGQLLGKALAGYQPEVIGWELGRTDMPPQARSKYFDAIDTLASYFAGGGKPPLNTPRDGYAFSIANTLYAMREHGARLPGSFPVDAFANPEMWPPSSPSPGHTYAQWHHEMAASDRAREGLVLRQVWDRAAQLALDGRPHTFAVVSGAYHTHAPLAAQLLGAQVRRVQVDLIRSPGALFGHYIRTNHEIADDPRFAERCLYAEYLAFHIVREALGTHTDVTLEPGEIIPHLLLINRIGMMCLRAGLQLLQPERQAQYEELLALREQGNSTRMQELARQFVADSLPGGQRQVFENWADLSALVRSHDRSMTGGQASRLHVLAAAFRLALSPTWIYRRYTP